jgi:hypothetical protein
VSIVVFCGHGNSEAREGTFRVFSLDPTPSHELLANLYDGIKVGEHPALDCAVLAWLSVSAPCVVPSEDDLDSLRRITCVVPSEDDLDSLRRITCLTFSLASEVLSGEEASGFTSDAMLALKAFNTARRSLVNSPSLVENFADLRVMETALRLEPLPQSGKQVANLKTHQFGNCILTFHVLSRLRARLGMVVHSWRTPSNRPLQKN